MNTISLNFRVGGSAHSSRWSQVTQSVARRRYRTRSHNELVNFSDRIFQDIGMARCAADFEAAKPFWQA